MAVKVIKAKPKAQTTEVTRGTKKRRVAAYCRVSTDMEEQESSYEAQCEHYTNYINTNPEWELAGIFADSGISGTSTKHREQFNNMIEACQKGEVDMVITKSISRFARNTLDCLKYIRLLKDLDIPVLFEKENINTLDSKGEILITIMASIAQQESQSISQNVRMGIQYRMQQGKGILNTESFLGFDKDENGNIVIVPEEADLIRRIYREYLEGRSPRMIAQRLTEEGVPSPKGCKQWHPNTVRSMLQNEKYAGDLLMQKYYTESFLTHKMVKNKGKFPQYLVENHHDPIVPKEVFNQVQWEMRRRGENGVVTSRYANRLSLNGKIVCGKCGKPMRRYARKDESSAVWHCRNKRASGGCDCQNTKETVIHKAVMRAFRQLPKHQISIVRLHERIVSAEIAWNDRQIAELNEEIAGLQDGAVLEERIFELNTLSSRRADLANEALQARLLLDLIEEMTWKEKEQTWDSPACHTSDEFYRRTAFRIPEEVWQNGWTVSAFNSELINRFVKGVTVRDDRFVVCFKGGVCIRVER